MQSGGGENSAWVIFLVDNVISVEVQWNEDEVRCKGMTAYLADAHFRQWGRE